MPSGLPSPDSTFGPAEFYPEAVKDHANLVKSWFERYYVGSLFRTPGPGDGPGRASTVGSLGGLSA
jgi:hypothetical protein